MAAALPKLNRLSMSIVSTTTLDQPFTFTTLANGCRAENMDSTAGKALGTRTHSLAGVVANVRRVEPTFSMEPTPAEWAQLLQWCLYGTPSGSGTVTFPLGTTALPRSIAWDDTVRYWELSGVCADRVVFSAEQTGPLKVDIEACGVNWTNSGTYPTGLTIPTGPPFIMSNLAIAVGAVTGVLARSIRITVENRLNRDRFFNSPTIAGPVAQDRLVTVELDLPYADHQSLWDDGIVSGGVAVVATFTSGSSTLVLNLPTVRTGLEPISANVPDEIYFNWIGQAVSNTGNGEMTAVLTV